MGNHLPTAKTADRRSRRLLRDLNAVGAMVADDGPAAGERLTATLGPELHQAVRAELDRLDSGTVPVRRHHLRVA